ncbi:ADP-ribosyl-[dinitrogen reductase] hydrolase [Desulfofundulus australicus DSM 11792]|uniref:ADP-ribosyl-[dinitrogen reductase] hydrolase n=1 Tax=Desulfofundulus australicus DSM 11792 TaxID=1121425 RepID=A0A1M5C8L1_9FIRM|nr:ADP-ribosyl-[dinitrogen reductase] hydrolase [Desulfofundulus australicus DSM 11792]
MVKNIIKGAFYGAAVGDALGGPAEFMSAGEIREKYGVLKDMVGGGWLNLEPGEYTDDTQMTLAVARGILANPTSPIEETGRQFIRWYQSGPRDIGNTTLMSLRNFLLTGNWYEASRLTAKTLNKLDSNGGLMRTLPVTFGYWGNLPAMARWSVQIAYMTHYSQEGATCCLFYNFLIYLLGSCRSLSKREAITRALQLADKHCRELNIQPSKFFWYIIRHIQEGAPEVTPHGSALDTLAAALQCFLHTESFEDALIAAVNRGDDTDTAGTVTGGLAGTYYGFEAIPRKWLEALKNSEPLEEISEKFYRLIQSSASRAESPMTDHSRGWPTCREDSQV